MQKIVPSKPNDAWSMDFVADQLADGSKFRMLTVVDVFTKEALAIEVGQRLRGEHVVSALNRIAARRGAPRHIFVDNGSEFSGRLLGLSVISCSRHMMLPRRMYASQTESPAGRAAGNSRRAA
ncbi:transposase family protein [Pandoraea pnomenusa]|nr:transposase family protein [Pandoraea pnomenusa]